MSQLSATITLENVTFAWPDGGTVLQRCSCVFGSGTTGLVGDNGAGKTTLLRLIAGHLTPSSGTITTTGTVGYLPQDVALHRHDSVADLLNIRNKLQAMRAIESGRVDSELFETVGEDWDIESRTRAVLDAMGLGSINVDRGLTTLSGGETMLVALAGMQLARTSIVLLDEPTNNLDRQSRQRYYDVISTWPGTLVVVSHDVTLLDMMAETAELRDASIAIFGGSYAQYSEYVAQEQQAAQQAVSTARHSVKKVKQQQRTAEVTLGRRHRYAEKDYANKRKPKVVMNQRRSQAQVSAGKLRENLADKVTAAEQKLRSQQERIREEAAIRIELPDPQLHRGRIVAELYSATTTFTIAGQQHVAITGRNGVGKTLLLETLFHPELHSQRTVFARAATDRLGYLPQRLDNLTEDVSALDNVRAAAPQVVPGEIRQQLARFLLRGDMVDRHIWQLSGGERFRVALAQILLAQPANQLIVLDEPTNNLDLHTVAALVGALATYRGALLVVSHDDAFLQAIGIDTWLHLPTPGQLIQTAGPL